MRPVRSPDAAIGSGGVEGARVGDRVAIRWPLDGGAEGARHLDPAAIPDEAEKGLEARMIDAGQSRHMAHMVDDHRHGQARDPGRVLRKITRVEQKLEVPAHLPRQRAVVVEPVEAYAAPEQDVQA